MITEGESLKQEEELLKQGLNENFKKQVRRMYFLNTLWWLVNLEAQWPSFFPHFCSVILSCQCLPSCSQNGCISSSHHILTQHSKARREESYLFPCFPLWKESLPADFSILIFGQNCITLPFLNQSQARGMELLRLALICQDSPPAPLLGWGGAQLFLSHKAFHKWKKSGFCKRMAVG